MTTTLQMKVTIYSGKLEEAAADGRMEEFLLSLVAQAAEAASRLSVQLKADLRADGDFSVALEDPENAPLLMLLLAGAGTNP